MRIGDRIINEIIQQAMYRVAAPDPDVGHIFVWSENASDQLSALVQHSAEVQIPTRVMSLFGEALGLAGAPLGNHPNRLIRWATNQKKAGEIVKSLLSLSDEECSITQEAREWLAASTSEQSAPPPAQQSEGKS